MSDEPSVRLFSAGLLSKWGFGDGDTPDHVYDYCDEHGIPYLSWHPLLVRLVREFLLPVLDQRVEVVEISTHHNPIRAEKVDGVDVTDGWYEVEDRVHLTPEYVDIPLTEVVRVAGAA